MMKNNFLHLFLCFIKYNIKGIDFMKNIMDMPMTLEEAEKILQFAKRIYPLLNGIRIEYMLNMVILLLIILMNSK